MYVCLSYTVIHTWFILSIRRPHPPGSSCGRCSSSSLIEDVLISFSYCCLLRGFPRPTWPDLTCQSKVLKPQKNFQTSFLWLKFILFLFFYFSLRFISLFLHHLFPSSPPFLFRLGWLFNYLPFHFFRLAYLSVLFLLPHLPASLSHLPFLAQTHFLPLVRLSFPYFPSLLSLPGSYHFLISFPSSSRPPVPLASLTPASSYPSPAFLLNPCLPQHPRPPPAD